MPTRFLQIHTLTSYPACLLNRDDAGFAKQIPFGSAIRTRISSQCLKRHWRVFSGAHSLASLGEMSVRSRHTFEKVVLPRVLEKGIEEHKAKDAIGQVMKYLLGEGAKAKAEKGQAEGERSESEDEEETPSKKTKKEERPRVLLPLRLLRSSFWAQRR